MTTLTLFLLSGLIQWLRYVAHADVSRYLAKGWLISDDLKGTSHGAYSVLMVWGGEDEPA